MIHSTAQISKGTILADNVIIGEYAVIGAQNGADTVGSPASIGASVHIGPHAVVYAGTVVGEGAYIGAGSIILSGIAIGAGVTVGPGSVVYHSVEPGITVTGNPARAEQMRHLNLPGVSIHPDAIVETSRVGEATSIWAFVHILPQASIGREVNICDHVFIENDVIIGDRVTVKCGVSIWDGARIEDDVFIGPDVTFTNDKAPRSKVYPEQFLQTQVRKGASLGANATILPGLTIGQRAMVGAGAVVTRDVPPNAIVVGNPARIVGYVDTPRAVQPIAKASVLKDSEALPALRAKGVKLHRMPIIIDLRGALSFGEIKRHLPFTPKRFFAIYDVPSKEVRGEHAHLNLHQFLVCLKGTCSVVVDDGWQRDEVVLDSPAVGLHIPPLIWGIQYQYSDDALLLVFASDVYQADDYIRDYDQFLVYVREVPHVAV